MSLARSALAALLVLSATQFAQAIEAVQPARLLNIGPAYSGSSINVVANRRYALFTHARMQFAAYYDTDHYLVLARRTLGSDEWVTRRSDFKGNVEDAHNSISIAVDGAGILHVAWDHHDSPLNYARGVRPLGLELARVSNMTGVAEARVTYPEFHLLADGDLLFLYRDGQSGRGRLVLNRYFVKERAWKTVQSNLIDGEGARSPYWSLAVDRIGGVHLAWTWRETPDVATNHDLAYAFSTDGGVTWRTSEGTSLDMPLTVATDSYAARIPTQHNLMNPPWITADWRGRPYIVSYWSDALDSPAQFRVVYRQKGSWQTQTMTQRTQRFELAGMGTRRLPISRGVLVIEGQGDEPAAHLIYRDDAPGNGALLISTERMGSGEWRVRKLTRGSLGAWEPTIDPVQWQRFQELHLLIQPVQQRDGNDAEDAGTSASNIASLIVNPRAASSANGAAPEKPPQHPTSSIVLTACKLPGLAETARCGMLDVPENPAKPSGRRLQIGVAVIPATTGEAQADPLVPLMGGPGEAAISEAAYFAEQFAPLRRDHDILLVDQRGTGRSSTLRCDLYAADDPAVSLRDLFPPVAVKRCEQQLSARADLTQYTYTHFAKDLEQVRTGLGYGKMNLFGGSYGTRAAQVLMRAYPQSVRTAYLGSVVPIDVITPLTMAKSAQVALDSTLEACAMESACNTAFPNLREEFHQVMARLDTGEVRVAIPGRTGTFPILRGRVMEWFRSMNYRPSTAAELPWMIHRAYMGDFGPFVDGVLSTARGADAGLSFGLFFAITCNDDVAFMREADIVRETQGTFLGDYRARQQQTACKQWPKVSYPADYRTPVYSAVPTLFVSGELDGASPLWMTQHAAPGFSNRLEVVLGGKGHTDVTDCIPGLYEQFVRSGYTRGLDASACKPVPRPPFKTR